MRFVLIFLFSAACLIASSQIVFAEKQKQTILAKLLPNDSVVYYQCRVTNATIEIKTPQQQVETKNQQITFTEKFVIVNNNNSYNIKYYVSGLTVFPNRKFSGLKIREKAYWNFSFKSERQLVDTEVQFLAGLESNSKQTIETDYPISKYTTNQLIIKQRKNFEQLLPKEKISISELLKL